MLMCEGWILFYDVVVHIFLNAFMSSAVFIQLRKNRGFKMDVITFWLSQCYWTSVQLQIDPAAMNQ